MYVVYILIYCLLNTLRYNYIYSWPRAPVNASRTVSASRVESGVNLTQGLSTYVLHLVKILSHMLRSTSWCMFKHFFLPIFKGNSDHKRFLPLVNGRKGGWENTDLFTLQ